MQPIEVGEPFTFWAMDYMGPLPITARGNKHILVVMDHFTKWCEAFPTKDQKASTVADVLVSKIFSRFGPPVVLHSDQGQNFESNLMHNICNIMGIDKRRTTAYHPQCDGLVERQNRTLQNMLAAFASKREGDWDLWLDSVVYAYNTSAHESLGMSPYEIVFGRTPRLPLELELGLPLANPMTQTEYAHTVRNVLKDVHTIARQHLAIAQTRQTKQYNGRNSRWKAFEPGQAVWLKRPKDWKFGRRWIGPFVVLNRTGVNYKLQSELGKVKVAHHNNLKPCFLPRGPGKLTCPDRESEDFEIVQPPLPKSNTTPETRPLQRVRPPHLRQIIRPPDRYTSS